MSAIFDALRSVGTVALLLMLGAAITYVIVTWDAYSDIVDQAIRRALAPDDHVWMWRP